MTLTTASDQATRGIICDIKPTLRRVTVVTSRESLGAEEGVDVCVISVVRMQGVRIFVGASTMAISTGITAVDLDDTVDVLGDVISRRCCNKAIVCGVDVEVAGAAVGVVRVRATAIGRITVTDVTVVGIGAECCSPLRAGINTIDS